MFYVCTSMVMALIAGLLHDPRGSLSSRCWQRAAYTRLYSWGKPVIPNLSADMPVPFLISIEGNIGAGKSTLLDSLRISNPEWIFIDEPVGVWSAFQNEGGENMLEVFYKDRKRWSYTFQNCALLTRFQNIESAIADHFRQMESNKNEQQGGKIKFGKGISISKVPHDRPVFVTERCLDTDYQVFTKMLRAEGSIDKLEYDLYECWFSQLKSSSTQLSAIVHVDTSPDLCAERIVKRGRDGEEYIPIEYLQALDKYQRDWVTRGDVPFVQTDTSGVEDVRNFVNSLLGGK